MALDRTMEARLKRKINRVKMLRFFLELTQQELGDRLGCTKQYICKVEKSDNPPKRIIEQLEKWLDEQ